MAQPSEMAILACMATDANNKMIVRLLGQARLEFQACSRLEDLLSAATAGAGVLVLEEELLANSWPARLNGFLAAQPGWSDLPVVLLTARTVPMAAHRQIRTLLARNITLIERPIAAASLVSVLSLALQARRRQYEIRDLLASLERRVEERTAELARSKADLEQFAAVASHDLQEPLRMVSGFMTLLQDRYGPQLDETAKQYISFAVDGAQRMQQLIRDLLQYSRSSGKELQIRPVSLQAVYERVVADLQQKIAETGAELSCDQLPTVKGDQTLLSQVLLNLLTNAMKFRRQDHKPVVHVGASRQGEQWVISVSDNGIGFDPRQADKVFLLFHRLPTKQRYEGTGIGLATVKRIIDHHRGRIWAESQPDKGSTFFFTLPAED